MADGRSELRERVTAASPWMRGEVEVAAYMRISEQEVRSLVNTGALESHRRTSHRGILVNKADADAYIRSLPSGSSMHPMLREVAAA